MACKRFPLLPKVVLKNLSNQVNLGYKKMMSHIFEKEKRIELRFPVALPLFYIELDSIEKLDAQTHDISRQGVCLATDKEIAVGSQLEIILRMADNNETISKTGTVIWSAKFDDASSTHRIGIKLKDSKLNPVPLVLRAIMVLTQAHQKKSS